MADTVHSLGSIEANALGTDFWDKIQISPIPNIGNELLHEFTSYCVASHLFGGIHTE
jgi:hypothetical protein